MSSGAVFEVDHQGRIDGVEERRLGFAFILAVSGDDYRDDGLDLAVLVQLQVWKRVQLRIDAAADHDGDQGQHEDAEPIDKSAHKAAGLLRRRRRSVVGIFGHDDS